MSLAHRRGATFVVIMGEQELASGEVVLRDMISSRQQTIPQQQLLTVLAQQLRL